MSGGELKTERDGLLMPALTARRFQLVGQEGPWRGTWSSSEDTCAIGSHESNNLVIDDRTVSRFHCELHLSSEGARVRDLGSQNGTIVDGVRVIEAWLRDGSTLRLGRTVLQFGLAEGSNPLPISEESEFGTVVGDSIEMRRLYPLLQRAAQSDATVLLEGETGTGKEEFAVSLHATGKRQNGPFVVVDGSAMPANLMESELFGHERGAFTGAVERREGCFREASGGTLFLDEIGELPLELQPKLLRVLERREVRPVGGRGAKPVDVRVVAATNRDLRREVNEGRFRADLYWRLAVVKIELPPLRRRPQDIRLIVPRLLARLGADQATVERLTEPDFLRTLMASAWPGNVRQLRNYLEQCVVLDRPAPLPSESAPGQDPFVDSSQPYAVAKRNAYDAFERRYFEGLLALHGGNVSKAAKAAGLHRVHLHRLLRRHGLGGGSGRD